LQEDRKEIYLKNEQENNKEANLRTEKLAGRQKGGKLQPDITEK
jgi:hypothetical protein